MRTDEELVVDLQAGRTDALALLVRRWEQPLYRFVFRMLPRQEDAREICQETFLRVLDKAGHFREGARFTTWMYQIALNLCRDHLRRRRRWGALVTEDAPPHPDAATPVERAVGDDDPAETVLLDQRRRLVRRALDRIPTDQREVLVLKEFEGLKFREIADLLGCPESTVKSRMYYGLTGLKKALVAEGFSGGSDGL